MAAYLQLTEWLEGEPAGDFATPTPRDTLRPAPEPTSPPADLRRLREHVTTGRELLDRRAREDRPPPLATASPELDRLLEGGLPRGRLVELVGGRSSGRFSVTLALLAAATQAGEAAALVDLGDGLDPASAAALGVDLERLLWLGPRTLRQALAGAEMLVATGFPLVVVDLGVPPVRRGGLDSQGAQAAWLRLARAAGSRAAALFVSAPYRASGAAAASVLTIRPQAGTRHLCRHRPLPSVAAASPPVLVGIDVAVILEKARGRPPGAVEHLRLATLEALLHPVHPVHPAHPAHPIRAPAAPRRQARREEPAQEQLAAAAS
jgi:hypothetical protein